MKTLSYVKQALAVALLISASQATAMNTSKTGLLSRLGSGVKSVLTAHERGAAWATRKVLGCTPATDVNDAQTVLEKLEDKGWAGRLVEKTPAVTEVRDAQGKVTTKAQPAVMEWSAGNPGTKGIRSVINHVSNHSNKYLWGTRVALLAGIAYGVYALYKKYSAKPEEPAVEDNKEDAEPTTEEVEVVVTEETTAQPVQPVRSAQSYIYQPK
jgi:hypothetical protein